MPKNNRIMAGWGIANQIKSDKTNVLWVSDGSHTLKSVDPVAWKHIAKHIITNNGRTLDNINELEIINESEKNKGISNYVFANAFYSNSIFMIDLRTNKVVKEWDMKQLVKHQE